jgi:class 3 adenylate cyclase/CHASE2 domain-containing sensor protein
MRPGAKSAALRRRDWVTAVAVALLVCIALGTTPLRGLDGVSIDLLFWLRRHLAPPSPGRHDPTTVIVAVDEETYHREPFDVLPNAAWTREIARVLNALVEADAKVVGFDAIYPTSLESIASGSGLDRDFLLALHKAAQPDKIVLGEAQHQEFPIHPFAAQIFAVGERNIRSLNLFRDGDDVIRRIPLMFAREVEGGGSTAEPSLALELASRAVGAPPTPLPDGRLALAGKPIPGSEDNTMLVNFIGDDAIPTYSLADLQACAAQGNTAFFREHFAGKVVLLGAVLDLEDRQLTSQRFVTEPEHPSSGARCVYPPMTGLFRGDLVRDTIPGVYVHAAAVDNLLRGEALRMLPPLADWVVVPALALAAALLTMLLAPSIAGLVLMAGGASWVIAATVAFRLDVVLPLLAPLLAMALTFAILLGYRVTVTDRDKRLLRASFSLYLAPSLIDRMLDSDRLPELGGERRVVTVFFSDLAGFTSLSERLAPSQLVAVTNEYLTAMTEIIEAEGGYIDKYVGDAIVAIFGAPLDDADHALHAVRAALACRARLADMNAASAAANGHQLTARIGLCTGEAVVGNVGSRRRFNYTVIGDTVNLAARLEGVNKLYGTAILATAGTRDAVGDKLDWREIDRVRVVGREQPVTILEPLGTAGTLPAEASARSGAFAEALAVYRAGRFGAAAGLFDALATVDGPSRVLAARARAFLAAPPPAAWDGVVTLESK